MLNLEEIKAREQAATKGPWNHNGKLDIRQDFGEWLCGAVKESDADFIAHARTDIPALIAEVEQLRQDKECCLQTAKCNAEFYDETKKENATLKKVSELACEDLAERDYSPKNVEFGKKKFVDYFFQQAQEQEGKK